MQFLSDLTIRARLSFGFGIILALMVILVTLGIQKVDFIDRTLAEITDVNSVKQRYAINYRGSVHDRAIAIRDVTLASSSSQLNEFQHEIDELAEFYRDSEQKMQAMIKSGEHFSAEELAILKDIDRVQEQTLPLIDQIIDAKTRGESVDAIVLSEARPAFIQWLNDINRFIDYQEAANQTATPEARDVASGFGQLMLALLGCAVVFSALIGIIIERSIRASLGGELATAQKSLSKMAEGNLSESIQTNFDDSMMASLSSMQGTIGSTVSNIVSASEQLSVQLHDVSDRSRDVLKAAEQQAELTTNTAYQLNLIRENSDQVSQIASHTEDNSSVTVDYAKQGLNVVKASAQEMELISDTVNNTVEQIRQLEEQTKKIGGIASVISGISEQTNLLALNAAIEAARAGETGRGFAVVADEVRQLAQRTGEATAEIDKMINEVQAQARSSMDAMETTQPQVENGRRQTLQASELLQNIEQHASDSLMRVREVVTAASSQLDSIVEITNAMDQVKGMSTQSIDIIQTNNQATDALGKLSEALKGDVSFFKV